MSIEAGQFDWDSIPVKTGSIARPAAGFQFAIQTVAAGRRMRLLGGAFFETTDATGANRYPLLSVQQDGTNVDGSFYSGLPIIASQANILVSFIVGTGTSGVATTGLGISIGIGFGIEMRAGCLWRPYIANIQATDRPDGAFYFFYKEAPV